MSTANSEIHSGCIVKTKFVTPDSGAFFGYIDYIDRENAVRNDHISSFSIYADYMDNPHKTSDLFTNSSDHLSYSEKKKLQDVYSLAQERRSLMWQSVISFDNRWLEQNGLYDSETKILDTKSLMNYTRNSVNSMLNAEGLENAVWSAAIHYNTDNLHIHIATIEPNPTRKKIRSSTIRLSSDWIMKNNILSGRYRENENISIYAKKTTLNEKSIYRKLKEAIGSEYNIGKSFLIHEDGSIDLNFHGSISEIPEHAILIYSGEEYRGKFKMSSIETCRSKMVNQIIENSLNNQKINEVMRDNIIASMRNNILFEDQAIIKQFLYVYSRLPEDKRAWKYGMNKIANLRPELDKITQIWIEKHHSDEFQTLKSLLEKQNSIYSEAYGNNPKGTYADNKIKDLYKRCGNAILNQMKSMSFRDIKELETNSYIAAEVNEAAVTGNSLNFDGKINYKSNSNENGSKYWTDAFIAARNDLYEAFKLENDVEKTAVLEQVLTVFECEIDNGNDIAAYELGRCYKLGTFGKIDLDLSNKYYEIAFNGFLNELNSDTWLDNMIAASEFGIAHQNLSQNELNKAIQQFTKKAERDEWLHDYLNYKIGRMLIDGEGTEKNVLKGISYLEQSTSQFAYYTLGNLYYQGEEAENDYEKAYKYFSLAGFPESGKSIPFAVYNMAEMLEKGLVEDEQLNKDYLYEKALSEFIASENQEPNDQIEYKIASMLLSGKGCKTNEEAAEEYLIQSSEYGNTYAQMKLANLYIKSGDPDKAQKAVWLLQIAASSSNPIAQYQLGSIYIDESSKYFNSDKGISLLEKAAEQENSFAEYALGKALFSGKIVEKNTESALQYLNAASAHENQFAQYMLGIIYLRGEDKLIEMNLQKAIDYLNKSAAQGNAFAQFQLGKLYLEDDEVKDIEKAIDKLNMAAQNDNPYLKYNLGRLYLENEDIRDIEKAVSFLKQSSEQDNPFAAYILGKLYSQDKLIPSDKKTADAWYRQAYEGFIQIAENDSIETDNTILYNLGIINYEGLGTEKDIDKALSYLLKAAQNDYEFAEYKLGKIYLDGKEVKKNAEYASLWLKKAATKGNPSAQYLLGKALIEEASIQNIPMGIEYLNASAEQGNDFSQYQLGKVYYSRDYGVQDIYQALIHFTDSAENGNEFAQYQLGVIYYKGDDIEQDSELAMKYLKLSAEQENQYAQYQLGIIYLKGDIAEQDIGRAVSCFEASAEQNNQFAQYQLGKIYYFGAEGIEIDKNKAIEYLTKSAAQGNEFAQALLDWKPSLYFNSLNAQTGFDETMISLSSDMRSLFERLANEHDHMLNQMIYQRLEKEKQRNETELN